MICCKYFPTIHESAVNRPPVCRLSIEEIRPDLPYEPEHAPMLPWFGLHGFCIKKHRPNVRTENIRYSQTNRLYEFGSQISGILDIVQSEAQFLS